MARKNKVKRQQLNVLKLCNVRVTAKDIRAGKRRSPQLCPIALCLRGVAKNPASVEVTSDSYKIDGRTFDLPAQGRKFVSKFDDLGSDGVEPLNLELSIPDVEW